MFMALGAVTCAFVLSVPMAASDNPAPETHKTTAAARTIRNAWPAETLSGSIQMVDPAANLVVVKDAGGVPFDITVTRSTRIQSGDHKLNIEDLDTQSPREVFVRFIPERGGDVAQSIQVTG